MDFSKPIGLTQRVVNEATHDDQPVRVVSGSVVFEADLADLWDAVTNPERLPRWFLPVSGDLKPGGRYQLQGHAGGKITRCDPPEAFDVTWECGDNLSWVRVRLQPDALKKLDAWRRHEDDLPGRPEAIRRLLEKALAKKGK